MDKEMLALLGDSQAFGAKLTELARATALHDAAQEAAKARTAEAEKAERSAATARFTLDGDTFAHEEKVKALAFERASFDATVKSTKKEHADRASALDLRERAVKNGEDDLAKRLAAIGAKEQAAANEAILAQKTVADCKAGIAKLKAAIASMETT